MSAAQTVVSQHLSLGLVAEKLARSRAVETIANGGHAVDKHGLEHLDAEAVNTFRGLVLDCSDQYVGGHAGSALGGAAIALALWKYTMRYNPKDDKWFDRDRFVMSNGHACIWLYVILHLAGYPDMTMDQLKGYTHPTAQNFTTLCHGHPEIEVKGIEVTTGPLGQGVANAVGMAIASKNLAATFNRQGYEVITSRIYCTTGDACLHEGVALESIAFAGHLGLDNLVLLYDNNSITNDAPLAYSDSDDVNNKMRASGWQVLDVPDGNYDVEAIVNALKYAKTLKGKPVFINIRTIIGLGSRFASTAKSHHCFFGEDEVTTMKREMGLDPNKKFYVSDRVRDYFNELSSRGKKLQDNWNDLVTAYAKKYPDMGKALKARAKGELDQEHVQRLIREFSVPKEPMATRASAGKLFGALFLQFPQLLGGSADLVGPNKLEGAESNGFQNPENKLVEGSYAGRFIRFGIREHGMTSIANGIAAYQSGTYIPFTGSFFMFYSYAVAGVRMGALNNLKVIHIATHDSIGEADNGPTHQPVELDSYFRALPDFLFIRPADAEEVAGAWQACMTSNCSSMLALSRQAVPLLGCTDRTQVQQGAYVVKEEPKAQLTIVSSGSELQTALAAAEELANHGTVVRVVSMPCMRLFDQQSLEYRRKILPNDGRPIVSLEPYITSPWAKYVTASIGIKTWGYSCNGDYIYGYFGLDKKGVVNKVRKYLDELKGEDARIYGWMDL